MRLFLGMASPEGLHGAVAVCLNDKAASPRSRRRSDCPSSVATTTSRVIMSIADMRGFGDGIGDDVDNLQIALDRARACARRLE